MSDPHALCVFPLSLPFRHLPRRLAVTSYSTRVHKSLTFDRFLELSVWDAFVQTCEGIVLRLYLRHNKKHYTESESMLFGTLGITNFRRCSRVSLMPWSLLFPPSRVSPWSPLARSGRAKRWEILGTRLSQRLSQVIMAVNYLSRELGVTKSHTKNVLRNARKFKSTSRLNVYG